jgi:hypothetical protein
MPKFRVTEQHVKVYEIVYEVEADSGDVVWDLDRNDYIDNVVSEHTIRHDYETNSVAEVTNS